jgi:hypothetical protein
MQYMIVPSRASVYIAPDLIVHYVEQHRYAPPAEFVDAMLACPEPSSAAYFDLLLPFADIWRLTPDAIRRIAADAPERRKAHAELVAQQEASKGRFKW